MASIQARWREGYAGVERCGTAPRRPGRAVRRGGGHVRAHRHRPLSILPLPDGPRAGAVPCSRAAQAAGPRRGPVRRTWTRVVAVGAVAAVVFAVFNAPSVGRLRGELRFVGRSHDDLVSILHSHQVQAGLRCGPLTFPNYRLVPDARFILDLPRERVGARSAKRRDRGVAIFVLGRKALRRFGFARRAPRTDAQAPGSRSPPTTDVRGVRELPGTGVSLR